MSRCRPRTSRCSPSTPAAWRWKRGIALRFSRAALLVGLSAACQNRLPGAPMVLAISPSQTYQGQSVQVRITGEGFAPQVVTNFKTAGQSRLNTTFQVTLSSSSLEVSLQDVTLQGD